MNDDPEDDDQDDAIERFMRFLSEGIDGIDPAELDEMRQQYERRMLEMNYILDDDNEEPRHPVSHEEYLRWCLKNGGITKQLAFDELPDGVRVSTIFMSLDHGFGHGQPVLYETMVFGGPHNLYQRRYHTKKQALAGHKRAVAEVSDGSHN